MMHISFDNSKMLRPEEEASQSLIQRKRGKKLNKLLARKEKHNLAKRQNVATKEKILQTPFLLSNKKKQQNTY